VQVTYLKDTVSQKDMEIEQLQLLKDKAKSPSSVKDSNGSSQHTQQLSGKKTVRSLLTVSSDPRSYSLQKGHGNQ
jgi:kinesin family member C2/C3